MVGQLPLFAVEEVYVSAATSDDCTTDDCTTGEGGDESTAERKSGWTVGEEGASAGLAPDLKEVPLEQVDGTLVALELQVEDFRDHLGRRGTRSWSTTTATPSTSRWPMPRRRSAPAT